MDERVNRWKFCIFIILFISFVNPVSSQTTNDWINTGFSLYQSGKYDKAIDDFNKAIAIDPNNKYAWLFKGSSYEGLGEYEKAIDAYNKALDIDPNFEEAWYAKGFMFFKSGEYDKAIEAYDRAETIR